ncbi:MAG: glycosyltransferase family 2 protein [Dokdonella sp.]|uniref:glycosyltransferase family 2 protein n=1 Tax=Dokdonella sp. TaxID=2291710 RepID=UPI00326487CC
MRSDHDAVSFPTTSVTPGLTSVVIVAADSGPLLQSCVDAVLASASSVEVVLVDNDSSDGEVDRVAATHASDPRLRRLRNAANLGFGPACNRGAKLARGDVFVFLNPDCIVEVDTILSLRRVLQDLPVAGVLGVTVCDPDGRPARGNRRRDPSLRRTLATMLGLSRFAARWPAFAGVEMQDDPPGPSIEFVDAISGACMTLTRTAFDAVAGFDERYFLHVEDLDLCRRVRAAGFKVAIVHALRVVHAQGSSSRRRPVFVDWHKHRGMWLYFRRFDPAARNCVLRLPVWLALWAHFVVRAPSLWLRSFSTQDPRRQGEAARPHNHDDAIDSNPGAPR